MTAPIDLISPQLLKLACPENSVLALAAWVDPLKVACRRMGIVTVRCVAALLAQAGHESCGLTRATECLTYSTPQRVLEVFGQGKAGKARFPSLDSCRAYVRQPEKLGSYVYANLMGNGPPASGDGFLFRGRGPFQLTGRNNYQALADALGMELAAMPAYLESIPGGAMSAAWFFKVNGLEVLAATPGVEDETREINGGLNGLADRKSRFDAVIREMLKRGA